MNKGEEHWVQLRIGSVDTDFTDTLNKPQHLVGESSTDSSGNYNRLLPECLTKKAKLEERKESKTKAEEPVDISLNEEDSKQNNISLRSGTRCDDITNNDRFSFNKLAIRRSAMLKEPVINDDNNSNSALEQMEAGSKSIKVRIPYSQIVKVLANYGRGLPVFFIYTTPLMGSKIRDVLNMISEDGFYYDPASKVETQKRIILLPNKLSSMEKFKFKAILNNFFDKNMYEELSSKEANDILVRALPKELQNVLRKIQMPTVMPTPLQTFQN
ncbi:uncharacterized protein LOC142331278 isoform X3 [Lycorma delicatula]|uniref:uncharacterized protein LOC142331278 isoform X3 n=1 Tax=Lycorma delicatula TaxID=130591 RepID=UPI003F510E8F